jgi:hypothetical protein
MPCSFSGEIILLLVLCLNRGSSAFISGEFRFIKQSLNAWKTSAGGILDYFSAASSSRTIAASI